MIVSVAQDVKNPLEMDFYLRTILWKEKVIDIQICKKYRIMKTIFRLKFQNEKIISIKGSLKHHALSEIVL